MEIYTTQPGDSLWSIAQRFRTTPERIAQDNACLPRGCCLSGRLL